MVFLFWKMEKNMMDSFIMIWYMVMEPFMEKNNVLKANGKIMFLCKLLRLYEIIICWELEIVSL